MKRYVIIWVLCFLCIPFAIGGVILPLLNIPVYTLGEFWGFQDDTLLVAGISLVLSTQITGFYYLSRKLDQLGRQRETPRPPAPSAPVAGTEGPEE